MASILDVIRSGRRYRNQGEAAWREPIRLDGTVYCIPGDSIDSEFEIEPDQDKLDKAACSEWFCGIYGSVSTEQVWAAALKWERERVK